MDLPISIGVLLAFARSLHDSILTEPHARFDAGAMRHFFLMIGSTLVPVRHQRARGPVALWVPFACRGYAAARSRQAAAEMAAHVTIRERRAPTVRGS